MYQRILVPFDGSPTSSRGLDEAIRLAATTGARLRLIYLVDDLLYVTGYETYTAYSRDLVPFMREAGEKILQDGQARAQKAGVAVETALLEGLSPRLADVVVEQIKAWGADLVVIGTHGRRGVGRLLLGSDAEQVLRSATVPVLLVRALDDATATGAPAVPATATAVTA